MTLTKQNNDCLLGQNNEATTEIFMDYPQCLCHTWNEEGPAHNNKRDRVLKKTNSYLYNYILGILLEFVLGIGTDGKQNNWFIYTTIV